MAPGQPDGFFVGPSVTPPFIGSTLDQIDTRSCRLGHFAYRNILGNGSLATAPVTDVLIGLWSCADEYYKNGREHPELQPMRVLGVAQGYRRPW